MPQSKRSRSASSWKTSWQRLSTDRLLDVRFCDLGLRIEGTALEERLWHLDEELERAEVSFRPYTWLSTDWFTPDGCTGFAIPFYLAHPRLVRLERKMMLFAEGGTSDWCMRLLRHETAHALDNAYRIRRRKRWREVFGPASQPYTEQYTPAPASRNFVHNLDGWYSQSHPVEDFAETFAVWLQPSSRWRSKYRGWPALDKLQYVDELMEELAHERPALTTRTMEERVGTNRSTLREHYSAKQRRYQPHLPSPYDAALRRVFAEPKEPRHGEAASSFLTRWRRVLTRRVSKATGYNRYLVEHVVNEIVLRCRALDLRVLEPEHAVVDASALVATLSQGLARGRRTSFSR